MYLPAQSSTYPVVIQHTVRFTSVTPNLYCRFSRLFCACDPSRQHYSNIFSWLKQFGTPRSGGNLFLFLPWGVTHWSKSCLKPPSYQKQLRICSEQSLWGWWAGKQFSWGAFISFNKKNEFVSKQIFPCFTQNIPFFALKRKKRYLPEKLSGTSNIHL